MPTIRINFMRVALLSVAAVEINAAAFPASNALDGVGTGPDKGKVVARMSACAAIRPSRACARSRYIAEQQALTEFQMAAQRRGGGVRDDARRANRNHLDRQIYRR
jgi:hypothetical protein